MTMEVRIEDLTFHAIVGILEHERKDPQKVVVDATFRYPYQKGRYLDYARARALIKEHLQKGKFGLLEEALLSLSDLLHRHFPFISELTLSIAKPQIFPDATPVVTFKRTFS